jgi:hypothetical protein
LFRIHGTRHGGGVEGRGDAEWRRKRTFIAS